MKRHIAILAAVAALALFGRDTNEYDRVETRKGVTYAQRGGLANSNEVVTSVSMAGMFSTIADNPVSTNADYVQFSRAVLATGGGQGSVVTYVNGKSGNVVLGASDVGALSNDWPTLESVAIGSGSDAADGGIAIGKDSVATNDMTLAIGKEAIAAKTHTTAVGPNAQALAAYSTAVGEGVVIPSTSTRSVAIGYGAQTGSAIQGLAIGYDSKATGQSSTAVGIGAEAKSLSSAAFGNMATAYGVYDTAIGLYAISSNGSSVAIGPRAKALYSGGIAIGSGSEASSGRGVAIGIGAKATANGAVAIGYGDSYNPLRATAQGAVAIGMGSKADYVDSVAVGYQTETTEANSMRLAYSGNKIYIGSLYPQSLYDYILETAPGTDPEEVGAIVDTKLASAKFIPSEYNYVKSSVTTAVAKVTSTVSGYPSSSYYTLVQRLVKANDSHTVSYRMIYPDWATIDFDPLVLTPNYSKFTVGHPILISTNDMTYTLAGYETLDQRIERKAGTGGVDTNAVKEITACKRDLTNNVCVADSFTAWDFSGAGLTDASLTLEQKPDESWSYYIEATIIGGGSIADYVSESGTKGEMENICSVSVTEGSPAVTYTITRPGPAKVAVSNDVFTTRSFVTNAITTEVVRKVNQYKNLHYDATLNVTWTNVIDNGHIYFITVTNANVSAAQ